MWLVLWRWNFLDHSRLDQIIQSRQDWSSFINVGIGFRLRWAIDLVINTKIKQKKIIAAKLVCNSDNANRMINRIHYFSYSENSSRNDVSVLHNNVMHCVVFLLFLFFYKLLISIYYFSSNTYRYFYFYLLSYRVCNVASFLPLIRVMTFGKWKTFLFFFIGMTELR